MRVYLVRDDDGERVVEAETMWQAAVFWKQAIVEENAPTDVSDCEPISINEISDESVITGDRLKAHPVNRTATNQPSGSE